MIQKNIEDITKQDLLALITNGVLETKTLDYKEKFSGTNDESKREILKDITSFANSSGGDIVYGIKEENGIPTELIGIPNDEVDSNVLMIEHLVRQSVDPRIPGIKTSLINVDETKKAVVFRIPKSWRSPHCVTFKNSSRFYARSSNGAYQLDVDELRSAFILSETMSEKISGFKNERIASIVAQDISIGLYSNSNIILHVIPMSAFDISTQKIDVNQVLHQYSLYPIYSSPNRQRINFDGVISYAYIDNQNTSSSYIQLYKNGIIEAVESFLLTAMESKRKVIPHMAFEKAIIESLSNYINLLQNLNVDPPFFVFLTLTGVKGYEMASGDSAFSYSSKIDRDILCLDALVIEDLNIEMDTALKPLFDCIWNACGFTKSVNFSADGKFTPRS